MAVWLTLGALSPPEPTRYAVVAATRDLPVGQQLTAEDLTVTQVLDRPPATAITDPAAPLGRRLASPLAAGEAVTASRLAGVGLLGGLTGRVAIPIPLPQPLASVVGAGAHLDLYADGTLLASEAIVLTVSPTDTAEVVGMAATSDTTPALVAVRPGEAQALSGRESAAGATAAVTVVLRSG